jgi:hypothetical protein
MRLFVYWNLSRYFAEVPTEAVGGFCGVSALCSLVAHCLFEETYIPSFSEMMFIVGLGIGPVWLAFFVWDYGMKKGDIKLTDRSTLLCHAVALNPTSCSFSRCATDILDWRGLRFNRRRFHGVRMALF